MEAQQSSGRTEVAEAIYGQILVTSLVAAFSEDETITGRDIFFGVLVTVLVFWMAHVYARAMAVRLSRTTNLSWRDVASIARRQWPIVQAALPSLFLLALGWAGLFKLKTAVNLALAAGVIALFLWGWLIARRSHMSWPATVGAVALSGSFGVAMILLKIVVH